MPGIEASAEAAVRRARKHPSVSPASWELLMLSTSTIDLPDCHPLSSIKIIKIGIELNSSSIRLKDDRSGTLKPASAVVS
jgi:hypothetical protein